MHHLKSIVLVMLLLITKVEAFEITGKVVNQENEPLFGVSVVTNQSGVGTLTDTNGVFILEYDAKVEWVTFSSVGYQSKQYQVADVPFVVMLDQIYYNEEPIIVTADRAQRGITPIAYNNLTEDEIKRDHTVGEFPMLLNSTPNLYAFADGGVPLGYSYVKVRGFDDKRIATYINGVPLNDPEDQATYFTDLPDFAANITDIQIQRGVGNSLYGDASFGGSLNIVTNALSRTRGVTLTTGYGEYTSVGKSISDVYKQSIEYSSGLIDGRWAFTGRFSKQKTGGYRENSWYEGWAYYFSMARIDPRMTTELYVYGGPIRMHLSYYGSIRENIKENRRDNPLTYSNETDNFNQPHYHLHNRYKLSNNATLSNTFYYIRGVGYYEQLKTLENNQDFLEYNLDTAFISVDTANLVRQQWVKKNQIGWNPRLDIEHAHGTHSIGGSFYYFESDHWGQIAWIEGVDHNYIDTRERYYQYYGDKQVGSLYAQEYYKLNDRLSTQLTAQLRYQRYKFDQEKMGAFLGHQYDVDWHFFSPRFGFNYKLDNQISLYSNFSVSSRTPTDASIYDANDPFILPSLEIKDVNEDSTVYTFGDPTAHSERVYDVELGLNYQSSKIAAGLNLFYMDFKNEILPYGGVDDDGLLITVNADRSIHSGLELTGKIKATKWLSVEGNFSYNYNRIKEYIANIDGYNVDFADQVVPGFPDYIGNLITDIKYNGWQVVVHERFIGKQYMELTNDDDLAINNYMLTTLSLSYRVENLLSIGDLTITGKVNNLFDKKYEAAGYGGNYINDWEAAEPFVDSWAEYYVGPERSFYAQLKLEMF
ncbi:MAG: TonB-dependent receptor [bacterium]